MKSIFFHCLIVEFNVRKYVMQLKRTNLLDVEIDDLYSLVNILHTNLLKLDTLSFFVTYVLN